MPSERIQFGIGYACFGALAAWTVGALRLGSFDTLLSALLYFAWGAIGLVIFSRWRPPVQKSMPAVLDQGSGQNQAAELEHEIKNYLYSLKGSTKLLRQRVYTGANGHILDRIDRVVEKLEGLTQHGKSPYPIGNSAMTNIRKSVNLGDVSRHCVHTYIHSQSKMFSWDIQPAGAELLGDPSRFEQVFLNLYINSIEAGASKVITRVRQQGNMLMITIEDDGRGLSPQNLDKIFEPFFTTKAGSTQRGLGMFIVQSIVESHGGKIWAESKNGSAPEEHGLVLTLAMPQAVPVSAGGFSYLGKSPEIIFK